MLVFDQAFEYRRKIWAKENLRILSQRSGGYERSSRGHLGTLMKRDRGGQEVERQQKDTCGLSPSNPDSDGGP